MTGRLPEGLINITTPELQADDSHRSTGEEDGQIPNEEIARAWKVYSTASHVTRNATGYRLQNLFWRIWSNTYLVSKISPSTVTELVFRFGQGYDRVEDHTLRPSPLALPSPVHEQTFPPVSSASVSATAPTTESRTATADEAENILSDQLSSTPSPLPPQSILKKPRSKSDPRRKSTTVEVRTPEENAEASKGELSGSQTETVSSTNSPQLVESRAGASSTKKRTGFVPTAVKGKIRPVLGRRKSSQSTAAQISEAKVKSPRKTSPGTVPFRAPASNTNARSEANPAVAPMALPVIMPAPGFALPSASSWQSVESESGPQITKQVAPQLASSVLVDPDFRDRFVENQRRIASASNLVATGRFGKSGSVVRFADEIPDMRKGKEKEAEHPLPRSNAQRDSIEGQTRLFRRQASSDSQVFEDEDENEETEEAQLPRTKSQLSMLIESRRRSSGILDLPADAAAQRQARKKKENEKKSGGPLSQEDEDDLIMMGRREGVTRAGGVAGRSAHRLSGTSQHRYRSPTPPPLYG